MLMVGWFVVVLENIEWFLLFWLFVVCSRLLCSEFSELVIVCRLVWVLLLFVV